MYYWIFFLASFLPFAFLVEKSKNMTGKQASVLFGLCMVFGGLVIGAISVVEYLTT